MSSETFATRFWAKAKVNAECWEWQGSRIRGRYGRVNQKGKIRFAHRVAWELARGPIPDGLWVLHHCDNPPCVRPTHLFLGTRQDNMRDMGAKRRAPLQMYPERVRRGERAWNARLTADAVRAIRLSTASRGALARQYGVSTRAIQLVLAGETWRHVR